jgi:glucokinase
MSKTLVVGLDLGGTKIAAGVVDSSGRLRSSVRQPTPARGVKYDLAAVFDAVHAAIGGAGVKLIEIRAIGVGVPGAFDPKTETVWAPNLPGWKKVPLKRYLERALERPVWVEGDRNVQALAEVWLGRDRKTVRNLIFLTVGTGIGAGLIVDGRPITGARGVAGAAGWMAIEREWQRGFGRIGCLEYLGAGPAVARMAKEAVRKTRRSSLRKIASGVINAELVVAAARRGDAIARQILDQVGSNLGRGVASMISLLNPDVVVVGGGLAGAGELLLRPLRREVKRWAQPLASRQVSIRRSSLEEEAGILGAARYALLNLGVR